MFVILLYNTNLKCEKCDLSVLEPICVHV